MSARKNPDRANEDLADQFGEDSGAGLFRVTVEYELVIEADSESDAEAQAEFLIRPEDGIECIETVATNIRDACGIPKGWHQAIPFGGNKGDERKCVERIRATARETNHNQSNK